MNDLFDNTPPCRHGRAPNDCPFCGRDEGMARADDHAQQQWKDRAFAIGVELADLSPDGWTADDIMARLEAEGHATHEHRAMGPVVVRVTRAVPCDDLGTEPSNRSVKRRGMVRRWRAIKFRRVCPTCNQPYKGPK